jgi:hypothetical protein
MKDEEKGEDERLTARDHAANQKAIHPGIQAISDHAVN